jgi:hypothetical protein
MTLKSTLTQLQTGSVVSAKLVVATAAPVSWMIADGQAASWVSSMIRGMLNG